MKKLLYVRNTQLDRYGANKIQIASMCKAFSKSGLLVTFFGLGKSISDAKSLHRISDEFEIIFLKPFRLILPFSAVIENLRLFFRFLKIKKQFDFLVTRDILFTFLASFFFPKNNIVMELHKLPQKIWWIKVLRKTTQRINSLIVISEGLKQSVLEKKFSEEKIVVLHDGVDLEKFDITMSQEDARKKSGLPLSGTIISYVGSTNTNRDLDTLIKASESLPDIYFAIYGSNKPYLEKSAQKQNNIILGGYTLTPEIIYRASDILFAGYTNKISTINCMSPLKIFEYMASKKPTIIADFPRTREILSDDETYFYKSEDSESIVAKIKEIAEAKNKSEEKSNKAFDKVKNYTWKERARKIISLVED
jgi:glycosyltransferase involved in cell wall biosynthesis